MGILPVCSTSSPQKVQGSEMVTAAGRKVLQKAIFSFWERIPRRKTGELQMKNTSPQLLSESRDFWNKVLAPFTVQFAPVHGHCMKYHAYQQDTHPHAKSFLTQNDRAGWWLLPCSPAWPAAFCPFSFRSRYMSRGAPGQPDRCFSSAFLLLIAFDPRRTRLKASGCSAALPSLLL